MYGKIVIRCELKVLTGMHIGASGTFSAIVLNPPIRAGKAVIYGLFAAARAHLNQNGALYIVIRKQQGAESAQRYLQTIYSDVERIARDKGYWVLRCAGGTTE